MVADVDVLNDDLPSSMILDLDSLEAPYQRLVSNKGYR